MIEITQFSVNSHDYSIEHINSYHKGKKMASWRLVQTQTETYRNFSKPSRESILKSRNF